MRKHHSNIKTKFANFYLNNKNPSNTNIKIIDPTILESILAWIDKNRDIIEEEI